MYWLLALMTISLLGIIAAGIYFEFRPLPAGSPADRWLKGGVGINLLTFVGAQVGLVALGIQDVMAEPAATEAAGEISVGMGLAIIGIGIPTALATVGAGIAVGPVGAASLAVIAEKPEIFGRTLVYLGLAEGIAIYGLVVTILLLGRI
ncbi:MAG: ATP synthase subunit C [Gammaproteobacteria bacterium]|nr:ATP synthase subunit C [Gammaproteobacteria bacterium]MDJ0890952.1 ATP synthase subunit C [Gammaproteobacteria bacterium]